MRVLIMIAAIINIAFLAWYHSDRWFPKFYDVLEPTGVFELVDKIEFDLDVFSREDITHIIPTDTTISNGIRITSSLEDDTFRVEGMNFEEHSLKMDNKVVMSAMDLAISNFILAENGGVDLDGDGIVEYEYETVCLDSLLKVRPDSRWNKHDLIEFLTTPGILKNSYNLAASLNAPVSVLLAQLIHESAMGKSSLCDKTRNYWNIKCRCRHDKNYHKTNLNARSCTKGWDSIERSNDPYVIFEKKSESFDYVRQIYANELYAETVHKAFGKNYNWQKWCDILHQSPYATDKKYGDGLKRTITTYGLNYLDPHYDKRIINNFDDQWVLYNPHN